MDPSKTHGVVTSFDGAAIAYRDFGGGGPALVLLPGWACTQALWDRAIPHLQSFRVVTLDYVGFGASASVERDWTMENFARDVRAVLESLDASGVTLVGHSMGGAVAVETAILVPERVRRVIGCDSFTYPTIYERQTEDQVEATVSSFRADYAGAVRGIMPAFLRPDAVAANTLALDTMVEADAACAVPALEGLLRWDLVARLGRCPVAVSTVNAADFLAEEVRQRYADRIAIRTIGGVGHFLMLERPDAFAAAVTEIATSPPA